MRPSTTAEDALGGSQRLDTTTTQRDDKCTLLHCNVRGFTTHCAELTAFLRLLPRKPFLVCLNETFLNRATQEVKLEHYIVVARRDRENGRHGGGVLVFADSAHATKVTLLATSDTAERVWLRLHTDVGPYLVCAWYRPPDAGTGPVDSFDTELAQHRPTHVGTVVLGDLNVHHRPWLKHSNGPALKVLLSLTLA